MEEEHKNSDKENNAYTMFAKKRSEVNEKIAKVLKELETIQNIPRVEREMLSLRQELLEDSHTVLAKINALRRTVNEQRGREYTKIANSIQLKLKTSAEREAIANQPIAKHLELLTILDNHVKFNNDTMKTIEAIGYHIKTRVELHHLLGSGVQ